jgi:hypothetical protein
VPPFFLEDLQMAKTAAWQRKEGQSPSGGLNEKGRASLRAQGQNIKRPVTSKEADKSPAAAQRRENFRTRMCGMKEKLTSPKTKHDPNSRINLALKRWDVKC